MSPPSRIAIVESADPLGVPRRIALVRPDSRPEVRRTDERYVMSFPHLIVREVILFQLVVSFLAIAALLFNAPLESMADPVETPNPAKAPWYFLGLQELLHYFPPVVAGFLLPALAVLALAVIPYARINLVAGPLWASGGRRTAWGIAATVTALSLLFGAFGCWPVVVPTLLVGLLMFLARGVASGSKGGGAIHRISLPEWIMIWFVTIASTLTIIGTFFRGPGWSFVWPWAGTPGM